MLVHLMTVSKGVWIEVLCFISPSNKVGGNDKLSSESFSSCLKEML